MNQSTIHHCIIIYAYYYYCMSPKWLYRVSYTICKVSFLCFTGSLFEEYCALAEYEAEDPSQVSFTSGQIVLVLAKHDESGWSSRV